MFNLSPWVEFVHKICLSLQLQEQLERFMKMNTELRHKQNVLEAQLRSSVERKADMEADLKEKTKEIERLSARLVGTSSREPVSMHSASKPPKYPSFRTDTWRPHSCPLSPALFRQHQRPWVSQRKSRGIRTSRVSLRRRCEISSLRGTSWRPTCSWCRRSSTTTKGECSLHNGSCLIVPTWE